MKSKMKRGISAVVAAALSITAVMAQGTSAAAAASYNVSVITDGHGSASASTSSQAAGGQVTFTAKPNDGYEFDHWELSGSGVVSTSNQASVVFVLDTTGSMSGEISSVKSNLQNLVQGLDASGIALNMSIIEYSDIIHNNPSVYHTFSNGTHWTTDVSEAVEVFDSIYTGRGSDETPTDAFTQLLNSDGSLNFPSGSVNNHIFLLTDEDYYELDDPSRNWFPMATWVNKFVDENIKVSVVTTNSCSSVYEDLYTNTGGIFLDINSSDYSEMMNKFGNYIEQSSVSLNDVSTVNPYTLTMPACNITVKACFKQREELSVYVAAAKPHSYVFSYDADMNYIDTNCNRDFDDYPEYVTVKIKLGKEYAGRTGSICSGRKSSANVIERITLDENGSYSFEAGIRKNYSFVLDEE